jgi:hypothetical protein
MDNKKLLLCISSAVIITILSASFNSWAQLPSSYSRQQESREHMESQIQKQIILQGNSQREQVLDKLYLDQQQLIIKEVTDKIVTNPTQADKIIRTAVSANLGISDTIAAAAIKAVPEQASAITQAAVATCIPGQAYAIVYSAILAGADPATISKAAKMGGATSAQIKKGEIRALQQLQIQEKKDPDATTAKTKSGSTAGSYSTSAPSPPPPVPKTIPKETQ